jgi:hypothetical protein
LRLVLLLITSFLALGLVFAACTDDNDNGNGNNGEVEATETPGPVGTPVRFPEPTLDGNTLTSPGKGYRATFPDTWTVRPAYGSIGGEALDVAFLNEDEEAGPVRPTMSIGCRPIDGPVDLEEFTRSRVSGLIELRVSEPDLSSRVVAGTSAMVVSYQRELVGEEGRDTIRQQEVYLVGERCIFNISLLTSPEEMERFSQDFEEMLSTFELIDVVTEDAG